MVPDHALDAPGSWRGGQLQVCSRERAAGKIDYEHGRRATIATSSDDECNIRGNAAQQDMP